MKYVLDPFLLALEPNCGEIAYLKFLQKINKWKKLIEKHPKDVYMLSTTEKILSDLNCYPMNPAYTTDNVGSKGHRYTGLDDLNQTLSLIFGKTKPIDAESKKFWGDVTTKELSCSILEDSEGGLTKVYKQTFERLLWYVFSHSHVVGCGTDAYVLFSKEVSSDLKVDVTYKEIVIEDDDLKEVETTTGYKVKCKNTHKEFLKDEDAPSLIWKDARSRNDIDYGIRVMLFQAANLDKLQEAYDNYNCVIQESFYEDFCNNHYANDDTILRRGVMAMAHIMMGANQKLLHWVRTGSGGANPQLVVKGYAAWRRNVTTSVKVTFWKKSDEHRFSNILEHDFVDPTQEFNTK